MRFKKKTIQYKKCNYIPTGQLKWSVLNSLEMMSSQLCFTFQCSSQLCFTAMHWPVNLNCELGWVRGELSTPIGSVGPNYTIALLHCEWGPNYTHEHPSSLPFLHCAFSNVSEHPIAHHRHHHHSSSSFVNKIAMQWIQEEYKTCMRRIALFSDQNLKAYNEYNDDIYMFLS